MNPIAIVAVLAAALGAPDMEKVCHKNCPLSDTGSTFISRYEGYSPYIYKDSAGLDTIGIGHLIRPGEKFEEPMTLEEAHDLLKKDAQQAVKGVNRSVQVPLRQHQADALISFTFNVGEGSLRSSSLLRVVNKEFHEEAPGKFLLWNKARVNGKLVPIRGLTIRRAGEGNLYKGESNVWN